MYTNLKNFSNKLCITDISMLWTGICRDCRMAIAPDVEAAIKETFSSSLADVSKIIENVTLVSQAIIKIYIINNVEMLRPSKRAASKAKLTGAT